MDENYKRVNESHSDNESNTNGSRDDSLSSLDEFKDGYENMSWMASFWLVARRATPMIVTMIFFQMVQLLNIYYVGQ